MARGGRFSKSRKFPLTNANKENGICFHHFAENQRVKEMRKQLLLRQLRF